jgi:hypothetical protein
VRKTGVNHGFFSRKQAGNQETFKKHSWCCAERKQAVDGTPFGDFPAEKAS